MNKRLLVGFYDYTVVATYLSLISSAVGIFQAACGNIPAAAVCLIISGFLDMFDGMIARTRKNRTREERLFGIQIDSLTDLVCFGVLPAAMCFSIWRDSRELSGVAAAGILVVCGLFVLAALVRLAYYNVTEEIRTESENGGRAAFAGLPVTTGALIFPMVYALFVGYPHVLPVVFTIVLLLTGAAFVANVRVRKPGKIGAMVMTALGLGEIVLLFVRCAGRG